MPEITQTPGHHRMIFRLTAVMSLLFIWLFSGCIQVTERSVAPLELPSSFSGHGGVPLNKKWWLDFQDDSLSNLIEQAINQNFTLLTARERIEEARAVAIKTGASLIPSVNGLGAASSTRNHTTDTTSGNFLLELAASYEIDLWGRLRSARDGALLDLQATEADYYTAAITISAEVALAWYQLIETGLQLDLLTKQQEINTKVLELISVQFRSGQTGIADVLQQRQLVESNSGDLAGLRGDIRLLEHRLVILLGEIPGRSSLPESNELPLLPPLPETGVPLDLLTNRPDIESVYLKLQAADNRVASAIADRFPKLSLSAELTTSGERADDLFNNWFSTLGANLFGPIIDGGRRKAEVERTKALAMQLFYGYGQTILEAIGEVEDALVNEKEQKAILKSQEVQLQLAAETIEHVANRYRQGAEDYQRVLLALLSHQNLQRNILTSRRQLLNNRISLYRALSGRIPMGDISAKRLEYPGPPLNTNKEDMQ